MNVKIQGGGNGTYANTGSCVAVTNYLQHEDLERMKKGEEVQPFFNQFRDYVSAREVTFKIDNNKAKLSRTDAKFYVITVSPSEKELRCMGRTPQERAEALQRYIRQDVMRNYAEGFGKGLRSDDVEYYAEAMMWNITQRSISTGTVTVTAICTHISSSVGKTGATPKS
ncbi:DUF5712 family protein (plasmid) [Phocaeicola vulgatus]|nr:DUF5712 family protein [Phocaeicola vulgatus]